MRRPAEVKEDVKQMEQRQRVSLIMSSKAFRDELEHLIHEYSGDTPHPTSAEAIRQISEMITLPKGRFTRSAGITQCKLSRFLTISMLHLCHTVLTTPFNFKDIVILSLPKSIPLSVGLPEKI